MKRFILSVMIIALSVAAVFSATSAAFEESVKVAGTSFSIGTDVGESEVLGPANVALKLFDNLGGSASVDNLVDSVPGPDFVGVNDVWTDTYLVKAHNSGDIPLDLVATANYVSDPDELRDDLFIEIIGWDDTNNNGVLDAGEETTSYGYDSILRFKNDTFLLGSIAQDETRGFVLRFDGSGLTEINETMVAEYDFLITGVE